MSENKNIFFEDGKQIIFHNIGTCMAQLQSEYVQYLQLQINEVKKYSNNNEIIKRDYYGYKPIHDKSINEAMMSLNIFLLFILPFDL